VALKKREVSRVQFLTHWVLLVFVMLATVAQAAPQARWTIIAIPPLLAHGSSHARDINNRGQVVGSTSVADPVQGTAVHGFVWDNGTMIDLGRTPTGSPFGDAIAINDRGTLIAGDGLGGTFTWRDGAWTRYQGPGFPAALNKFDVLAGIYTTSSGSAHGFLYNDGVLTDLGTLGGPYSEVSRVNDKGVAVGKSMTSNFEFHPYVYEGGAMKDLGTFGGRFGDALGVNNHGTVVGAAYDSASQLRAFVYDGTAIRKLFPDSTLQSQAIGINDRGTIIGSFQGINNAFVYDGGVLTMIEQIPEVRAAGWSFMIPTAINNRGWITGYGRRGSSVQSIAFVLIPK
jgi:probable HAF family extracellular repeat protein